VVSGDDIGRDFVTYRIVDMVYTVQIVMPQP
jgi:hypothetical protein